mgnify:CR=1 FL=1
MAQGRDKHHGFVGQTIVLQNVLHNRNSLDYCHLNAGFTVIGSLFKNYSILRCMEQMKSGLSQARIL